MKTDTRETSKTIKKSIMLTKRWVFDGFGCSCYLENFNFLKILGPPGPPQVENHVFCKFSKVHETIDFYNTFAVFLFFFGLFPGPPPGPRENCKFKVFDTFSIHFGAQRVILGLESFLF